MGNSLRCCLACVLPCGALDLIRIVHLNGHVEELSGRVNAGDVLKNNPNHILTKPCSSQGVARRILILSPESDLKRGSIYFLIPSSSLPAHHHHHNTKINKYDQPSKQQSTAAPAAVDKNPRSFRRRKVSAEVQRTHLESISEDL
ncbi:hypothetical protein ABFS83_14G066900 [Erythranthe nasuta]